VQQAGDERATVRAGRCATHASVAQIGTCDVCGRALCLTCAVPVRGALIGRECLATVLEDAPPPVPAPLPALPGGEGLAITGFALVLVLSALPWSRFGSDSGPLGAWSRHWSLLGLLAALAGLAFATVAWRHPRHPVLEAAGYAIFGSLAAAGCFLHHIHPPPLSASSGVPLIAVAGAILAGAAAAKKAMAVLRLRRLPA
jgi:hypothetical protein